MLRPKCMTRYELRFCLTHQQKYTVLDLNKLVLVWEVLPSWLQHCRPKWETLLHSWCNSSTQRWFELSLVDSLINTDLVDALCRWGQHISYGPHTIQGRYKLNWPWKETEKHVATVIAHCTCFLGILCGMILDKCIEVRCAPRIANADCEPSIFTWAYIVRLLWSYTKIVRDNHCTLLLSAA